MVDPELFRGGIASLVSSALSNGMNIMGTRLMGLTPDMSSFIFLSIFGNLLGYSLDILFAKRCFEKEEIPITYLKYRFLWWLKSFTTPVFMKFFVVVIIDLILFTILLRTSLKTLDEKGIKFRFRDAIVAAVISIVTFVLYVNFLRFKWAYVMNTNPVIDMVILAWSSTTVILYFMFTRDDRLELKHRGEEGIFRVFQ